MKSKTVLRRKKKIQGNLKEPITAPRITAPRIYRPQAYKITEKNLFQYLINRLRQRNRCSLTKGTKVISSVITSQPFQ